MRRRPIRDQTYSTSGEQNNRNDFTTAGVQQADRFIPWLTGTISVLTEIIETAKMIESLEKGYDSILFGYRDQER